MAEYRLKFLFANHDGVVVEATIPDNMTVLQLKESLLSSHWPEGKVDKASGPAGIRLLCMGRMLDDGKTLEEMKIPKYEHPTPVNVSLLPKGKTYSESTNHGSSVTAAKVASPTPVGGPAQARPTQAPQAGGGGCCTIS